MPEISDSQIQKFAVLSKTFLIGLIGANGAGMFSCFVIFKHYLTSSFVQSWEEVEHVEAAGVIK